VTVDGGDWYLVGPDEWLEGRLVAAVFPNPKPPEGVENGRWIEINLAEQTLAVYDGGRMVFATVVSTGGSGQWTRPGLFQAYSKIADETMSGSFTADRSDFYYIEGVVWTVYFDAARALHGAYWHSGFGVPLSRGCVNLSTGDAQWVFNWIEEGDWIYVWDPTGLTPTDPALYGDGGA
jgi:lipoprotein-anchoring transpeptidase ErfK/SrfK